MIKSYEEYYKDYKDISKSGLIRGSYVLYVNLLNYQQRIDKAIQMLELSESRKRISKDFVNIGRKKYDAILNVLKGSE